MSAPNPLLHFSVGQETADWAKLCKLNFHFFPTTESTSLKAKDTALNEVADISLYITEHQTMGKGRGQHSWSDSGEGKALLCTWSLSLSMPPPPVMSCRMGLAIFKALQQTWPWLPWSLKAPNDVFLGDRKVAGVLLENIQQGSKNRLLIGLGLNVFAHPALPTATDIVSHLKIPLTKLDWNAYLDRLLLELTLAATKLSPTLDLNEQNSLVWALNLRPNLDQKVVAVSPEGSIHTSSGILSWHEL